MIWLLCLFKKYKTLIAKVVWLFAPLLWGLFSWSMWKVTVIAPPLKWFIMAFAASAVIVVCFRHALNRVLQYKLQAFNYSIKLPPWWVFLGLIFLGISISVPLWENKLIFSIVQGILISSIFEEFIARSFFIKYRMGFLEFMVFNILSSLSFTLMHCFYGEGFIESLTVGHLGFSFALGLIVYKTQRIELSILLHMLSNFARYTLPAIIFNSPWPSLIAGMSGTVFEILFYVCLAGCTYSKISKSKSEN